MMTAYRHALKAILTVIVSCGACQAAWSQSSAQQVMTVRNATTGRVIRTTDGGRTWQLSEDVQRPMRLASGSAASSVETLAQPNPSTGAITIDYQMPELGAVVVTLADLQGTEVARYEEGMMGAGRQALAVDGSRLPNGTYYYRLIIDGSLRGHGAVVISR